MPSVLVDTDTLSEVIKGRDPEEGYLFAGQRVNGVGLSAFVTVAPGAGQPQVVFVRGAAAREGNDVLDMHLGAANLLTSQAIATTIMWGRLSSLSKRQTGKSAPLSPRNIERIRRLYVSRFTFHFAGDSNGCAAGKVASGGTGGSAFRVPACGAFGEGATAGATATGAARPTTS